MIETLHHPVVYPKRVRGRPAREDQSRNGVRVIVRRSEEGSSVEADCSCFGLVQRLHSNTNCPLFRQQHQQAQTR